MKKYLIAMLLGLVLVLAFATTIALADNGPHGGFSANTDACAGCHRLHSAQVGSNELLIASDPEATCLTCHDGTGAGTNVVNGVYSAAGRTASGAAANEGVDGASLMGGGFNTALMSTAWTGSFAYSATAPVSRPTTSRHITLPASGLGAVSGTIWGSGAENTANGSMAVECTSCHDPHGTSGWTVTNAGTDVKVASYRLLRWQPAGSNGFTAPAASSTSNWTGGAYPTNDVDNASGWLVPDVQGTLNTEWYTIGSQVVNGTGPFAASDYSAGNGSNVYLPANGSGTTINYLSPAINMAFFCAQCHDRYFNSSRLRNNTDASAYCGAPYANMTSGNITLTVYADADGSAPYIHPVNATRCEPVLNSDGTLASWGDNGDAGDDVYTYRHTSGDVRTAADNSQSLGTGISVSATNSGMLTVSTSSVTSISRSCMACHVSHGTAAVADPQPANGVNASTPGVGSLAGGSVLLRMDGRTICLRCHASTVNFTVGTSASPVTASGLSVTSGPAIGGTAFSITGTGFATNTNPGVSGVRFVYTNGAGVLTTSNLSLTTGSLSAGRCKVTSTTNIDCQSPEGYGAAAVSVVTTGSVLTSAGTFTYDAVAAPTITGLSVSTGPVAGGTTVVITGTNFGNAVPGTTFKVTAVNFGFRSYSFVTSPTTPVAGQCIVDSTTQITCVTAGSYAGLINIKVTTSGGQFATTPFTFVP